MSRATAKAAYLALLQASEGKSKGDAQSDTANDLIDIIADLMETGVPNTTVTGTLPDGPVAASGTGTITVA